MVNNEFKLRTQSLKEFGKGEKQKSFMVRG